MENARYYGLNLWTVDSYSPDKRIETNKLFARTEFEKIPQVMSPIAHHYRLVSKKITKPSRTVLGLDVVNKKQKFRSSKRIFIKYKLVGKRRKRLGKRKKFKKTIKYVHALRILKLTNSTNYKKKKKTTNKANPSTKPDNGVKSKLKKKKKQPRYGEKFFKKKHTP